MTAALDLTTALDTRLEIGGREFRSRLMVGTGKYASNSQMLAAIEASGAEVVTVGGEAVGRCAGVLANPAADLIELDSGALVPVVFVVDRTPGRVTIDPPDGLFDL